MFINLNKLVNFWRMLYKINYGDQNPPFGLPGTGCQVKLADIPGGLHGVGGGGGGVIVAPSGSSNVSRSTRLLSLLSKLLEAVGFF